MRIHRPRRLASPRRAGVLDCSLARTAALRCALDEPTIKRHRRGTERAVPVADLLASARTVLPVAGVTRVARISGLDRIGLPVYSAIRPNSRTVSVSQGKGITDEAAELSAIMESLELYVAESRDMHVSVVASRRELERWGAAVLDPSLLRLRSPDLRRRTAERLPWVLGVDVMTGEDTWVPYEVVHIDDRYPFQPGEGIFRAGSNGLASGANAVEASVHALCELVERDATMALEEMSDEDRARRRVDLATVEHPDCTALIERLRERGMTPLVWDATDIAGLPTYDCLLVDVGAVRRVGCPLPQTTGAGTHPNPAIAVLRALTEAVQSRASVIAGAREDISRSRYDLYYDEAFVQAWQEELGVPATTPMTGQTTPARDDLQIDLQDVVGVLRARGAGPIVLVDLGQFGPAYVVRAVAPRLRWAAIDAEGEA